MLSERLLEAMKKAKINQSDLARACGVSAPSVNGWLSGKAKFLRGENLLSAAKALNVSQTWLATGMGDMDPDNEEPILFSRSHSDNNAKEGYVRFDLLNATAAAGAGANVEPYPEIVDSITMLESWANQVIGTKLTAVKMITARGDSMTPTIEDRDVLFVDTSAQYYAGEGVYVIAVDSDVMVKRLQRLIAGGMRVISDNSGRYPAQDLVGDAALERFKICGRVVAAWNLRKMG